MVVVANLVQFQENQHHLVGRYLVVVANKMINFTQQLRSITHSTIIIEVIMFTRVEVMAIREQLILL